VTDATAVQTTFGPDFGYVARPAAGLVLASTDLVAHEFVAHRWLAWTRTEATHGASAHWLLDGVYRQASLANRCLVQMVWGPARPRAPGPSRRRTCAARSTIRPWPTPAGLAAEPPRRSHSSGWTARRGRPERASSWRLRIGCPFHVHG